MRDNFIREINDLLAAVPEEQWQDQDIRGVLYDFVPWHRESTLTIQTREDDPEDIGDWKYYYSAESDGSHVTTEFDAYESSKDAPRTYHKLLMEAAQALLSVDLTPYGEFWPAIDNNGLTRVFLLQVHHPDKTYQFNYCEYVCVRQMERIEHRLDRIANSERSPVAELAQSLLDGDTSARDPLVDALEEAGDPMANFVCSWHVEAPRITHWLDEEY